MGDNTAATVTAATTPDGPQHHRRRLTFMVGLWGVDEGDEKEEEDEEEERRRMAAMTPKTRAAYVRAKSVRFSALAFHPDPVSGATTRVPVLTPHASLEDVRKAFEAGEARVGTARQQAAGEGEDEEEGALLPGDGAVERGVSAAVEAEVGDWLFGDGDGGSLAVERQEEAAAAEEDPEAVAAARAVAQQKEAKRVEFYIVALLIVYLPVYALCKAAVALTGATLRLLGLALVVLGWRLKTVAGQSDLAEAAAEYEVRWRTFVG